MLSLLRNAYSRRDGAESKTTRAQSTEGEPPATGGKSDLLMRFFESDWFDAWIALTYLYKSPSPEVEQYLCDRLRNLPEGDVEPYLSQLCQICVQRPSRALEALLVDLCGQSLRIAAKTYWLLLAISQDRPDDLAIAMLRDRCEVAALEGTWDLPFRAVGPAASLHRQVWTASPWAAGAPAQGPLGLAPGAPFAAGAHAGLGALPACAFPVGPHAPGSAPGSHALLALPPSAQNSVMERSLDGESEADDGAHEGASAAGDVAIDVSPPRTFSHSSRVSSASQGSADPLLPPSAQTPRRGPFPAAPSLALSLPADRADDGRDPPSPLGAALPSERPLSPGGLGAGMFGSVFVDAGVEGLMDYADSGRSAREAALAGAGANGDRHGSARTPGASARAAARLGRGGSRAMDGGAYAGYGGAPRSFDDDLASGRLLGRVAGADAPDEAGSFAAAFAAADEFRGSLRGVPRGASLEPPPLGGPAHSDAEPAGADGAALAQQGSAGGLSHAASDASVQFHAHLASLQQQQQHHLYQQMQQLAQLREALPALPPWGAEASAGEACAVPFSPPNSPRARRSTFGATLDFADALCTSSTGLNAFPEEDREWALRTVLGRLDAEVASAARDGVGVWFPQGQGDLRVARILPKECRLLNSREKAPFVLVLEVLDEGAGLSGADAEAAAAFGAAAAGQLVHWPSGASGDVGFVAGGGAAAAAAAATAASLDGPGALSTPAAACAPAAFAAPATASSSASSASTSSASTSSTSASPLSPLPSTHAGPATPPESPDVGASAASSVDGSEGKARRAGKATPSIAIPGAGASPAAAPALSPPHVLSPPHASPLSLAATGGPRGDSPPAAGPTSPTGFAGTLRAAAACVVPGVVRLRAAAAPDGPAAAALVDERLAVSFEGGFAQAGRAAPESSSAPLPRGASPEVSVGAAEAPEPAPEPSAAGPQGQAAQEPVRSGAAPFPAAHLHAQPYAHSGYATPSAASSPSHALAYAYGGVPFASSSAQAQCAAATLFRASPRACSSGRASPRAPSLSRASPAAPPSLSRASPAAPPPPEDSLNAGLRAAQESLRGEAPLVRARIVVEDEGGFDDPEPASSGPAPMPARVIGPLGAGLLERAGISAPASARPTSRMGLPPLPPSRRAGDGTGAGSHGDWPSADARGSAGPATCRDREEETSALAAGGVRRVVSGPPAQELHPPAPTSDASSDPPDFASSSSGEEDNRAVGARRGAGAGAGGKAARTFSAPHSSSAGEPTAPAEAGGGRAHASGGPTSMLSSLLSVPTSVLPSSMLPSGLSSTSSSFSAGAQASAAFVSGAAAGTTAAVAAIGGGAAVAGSSGAFSSSVDGSAASHPEASAPSVAALAPQRSKSSRSFGLAKRLPSFGATVHPERSAASAASAADAASAGVAPSGLSQSGLPPTPSERSFSLSEARGPSGDAADAKPERSRDSTSSVGALSLVASHLGFGGSRDKEREREKEERKREKEEREREEKEERRREKEERKREKEERKREKEEREREEKERKREKEERERSERRREKERERAEAKDGSSSLVAAISSSLTLASVSSSSAASGAPGVGATVSAVGSVGSAAALGSPPPPQEAGSPSAPLLSLLGPASPASPLPLPSTCGKNGWACKLGFCKHCAAAAKSAAAAAGLAAAAGGSPLAAGVAASSSSPAPSAGSPAEPTPFVAGRGKAIPVIKAPPPPQALAAAQPAAWAAGAANSASPGSALGRGLAPASAIAVAAPAASSAPVPARVPRPPRVRLVLTVQGGVDLDLPRGPHRPRGHARVPSHEALLLVAHSTRLPLPETPGLSSLPESRPLRDSERGSTSQGSQGWGADVALLAAPGASGSRVPGEAPLDALSEAQGATSTSEAPGSPPVSPGSPSEPETWAAKSRRLRAASPYGPHPGWTLRACVVKSGDDCRQELLAMQFIRAFDSIFREADLPLYLRPYDVLVTGSKTALIELVPDAPSIHALKARGPRGLSLRGHFERRYGAAPSQRLARAQRCFAESLAAYSVVCYLLQIRDRHNGNILLDSEGHLVHIDFGFMLSNSPGGVAFESAPFKLTRELLEVLDSGPDGASSVAFDYFKVLLIRGFLAVRKHADRIVLLAEMMSECGAPCFKARAAALAGLRRRFHLGLPEPKLVEVVLGLVAESLDAWRTRQYDYYQRVLNGIL